MIEKENLTDSVVLIVDDNPANLGILSDYLTTKGLKVSISKSGEQALQRVGRIKPDIILLDVMMPSGIDGFEVCRRLKANEDTREIPIIFMTALTETGDKVKGFEVGAVDYITKPFQQKEVFARVKAHLMIRNLQLQLQKQNERFQQLAEATFEGIIIHKAGRIVEVNQSLVMMFGYSRADLIGKDILELVESEFREYVQQHLQDADEPPYEVEAVRQDGSIFPVEIQTKIMPSQMSAVSVIALRDITWRKVLEHENLTLKATLNERYRFDKIIGKSQVMQKLYEQIVNAAATDYTAAIYGESGVGKELVARTIHQHSKRCEKPFVVVNCGAIVESLSEREFFGHRKGAFTGADQDKPGFLKTAHGGTLFLDEIGELSQAMQAMLLRVLESREYTAVGDTTPRKADVRIIAATNRDLEDLVRKGTIREDFFYRLQVITFTVPPLRKRKGDLPLLIDHFLERYRQRNQRSGIPDRIREALYNYDWPGNVRELQNEIQRYLTTKRLHLRGIRKDLPSAGDDESDEGLIIPENLSFYETIEHVEKHLILKALAQTHWQKGKAAEMLRIDRKTLYKKMKKLGVN